MSRSKEVALDLLAWLCLVVTVWLAARGSFDRAVLVPLIGGLQ